MNLYNPKFIQFLLEKYGLSQKEIAEKINRERPMTSAAFNKWIKGKKIIREKDLNSIAIALGIKRRDLDSDFNLWVEKLKRIASIPLKSLEYDGNHSMGEIADRNRDIDNQNEIKNMLDDYVDHPYRENEVSIPIAGKALLGKNFQRFQTKGIGSSYFQIM